MLLLQPSLAVTDLDVIIQENLNELKSKYNKYFPGEDFYSNVEECKEVKFPLDDSNISTAVKNFKKDPDQLSAVPFSLSYHLVKMASDCKKEGDTDRAWAILTMARYYAGVAEASIFGTGDFSYELINMRSINGNKTHSERSTQVKEKAAELIRKEAENRRTKYGAGWKGWQNRNEACNAIANEMRTFIRENYHQHNPDGIERRVSDWMREVEYIRAAYNETCAKGSTYSPRKYNDRPWQR